MNWYEEKIEEPLRELVKLLRDNGFNTTCACGHLPYPYIQMEWYQDSEITKLYNLLVENKYKNFSIKGLWYNCQEKFGAGKRFIDLTFMFSKPLAKLSDIKEEEKMSKLKMAKFYKLVEVDFQSLRKGDLFVKANDEPLKVIRATGNPLPSDSEGNFCIPSELYDLKIKK